MTASMEKPRDLVGGLVVMTIGAGFLLSGQALDLGSSLRMGPSYFPTILSILMIALGAVITACVPGTSPVKTKPSGRVRRRSVGRRTPSASSFTHTGRRRAPGPGERSGLERMCEGYRSRPSSARRTRRSSACPQMGGRP